MGGMWKELSPAQKKVSAFVLCIAESSGGVLTLLVQPYELLAAADKQREIDERAQQGLPPRVCAACVRLVGVWDITLNPILEPIGRQK